MSAAVAFAPRAGALHRPRGERRVLTAREERRLLLAAKDPGDERARDELTEAYLPRIAGVARIYRGSTVVDRRELMQSGVAGLLRALEHYDPKLETPFWAYAAWWVRRDMQQLVAELTRVVVLSDRALRQLARIRDARRRLVQALGREASTGELAEAAGLRLTQVQELLAADRTPRALEEPLDSGDDDGAVFGELLADPRGEDAYDGVRRRLAAGTLPDLLSALDDRERSIVCARFGLDGPEQTLRQLAGRFGVSAERVRQIERHALDKLHAAATG